MSSKTKAKTAVKSVKKSPSKAEAPKVEATKAEASKAATAKAEPKALVRTRPATEPAARSAEAKSAPAEPKQAPAEGKTAASKANGHTKTANGSAGHETATAATTPGSIPRSANGITVRPPSGTVVRPSRPPTPRATRIAAAAAAQPAIKGPFHGEDLVKWRQLLLVKRSEITNDIVSLEQDAMEAEDGHTTPQHTAERGSDADLQDVALNLAGQEKELLWQIDRALRKIESSDPFPFGLCEYTKQPIARGRLEQMPWTPLSIEGATHLERNGLTLEDLLVEG
ncbi:hypothetical protein LBMAG53_23510 [Planctomycetota bacterium]|nr:hypothetical protein LBMAG53_23510 [Planctomycetota bacterium]